MTQPSLLDICRNRHKDAPASIEANTRVNKLHDRQQVLEVIRRKGKSYSKEIAREMGREIHQISGRISEALALGLIERIGNERIEGCSVLRIK